MSPAIKTLMSWLLALLVMGILFWSVMITLTAWTLVQRHGKS